MAQTFFDQMGDMNAMQMLMGLMPGFGANKSPMGAAPMTFDTDPQNSIDRARAGVTKQPGMQPPPGGDPIAAMLPVTGAGNGFGPNAARDLDVANEVQGMGANNPLKNIDRANGSLRMPPMLPGMPPTIPPGGQTGTPPGFDAVPPAYTGPNNMDPDAIPPPYTQPPTGRPQGPLLPPPGPPAAPNVAGLDPLTAAGIPGGPTNGPFNQGGSPGGPGGLPGLPPGADPFKAAPPMLGPGAPNTTAMPPPDLQFPPGGGAPPTAGLPPAATPTLGTPLAPPAPRAGALPAGMGPDGRPIPSPLVRGLQSALGLDSRAGMAGLGKGLVAGAGTNPGSKLGAAMRGAGAAMGGRGEQEDKDRKANLEERKQDETELHSRWQEQQGNAKTFMENFMLPLRAEDMVAGTRLKNARSGSLDEGGPGGGRNAPWKSTPFGKVVTIDDQVQKSFAEDMKTMREQGRINGWTDKQFDAGSAKARQDAEKLRQELYRKHNITPGQANIERTRGASQKNPIDPITLGLSHEQFDKMVPPAKFNPDTGNWDGGWFIPKPGANPIQRFKPVSSNEDTQRKRQNETDADRMINAGSPASDYSEAA